MIKATRLRIGVEHCFYIFSIRGYPWNSPSGARRSLPDLGLSMLVKLLVFGFYNLPAYPVDRRHLAGKTEEISRKFRNNTHIAAWLADRYINISSLTGFCVVWTYLFPAFTCRPTEISTLSGFLETKIRVNDKEFSIKFS